MFKSIGEAAKEADVAISSIRFYERKGLLEPSTRTTSGRRVYATNDVQVLKLIVNSRRLGLTLEQIRILIAQLKDKSQDHSSVHAILEDHLALVRIRESELKQHRMQILKMLDHCDRFHRHEACSILEAILEDH